MQLKDRDDDFGEQGKRNCLGRCVFSKEILRLSHVLDAAEFSTYKSCYCASKGQRGASNGMLWDSRLWDGA